MGDRHESYDLDSRKTTSSTSPILIVGILVVVVLTIAALVLSVIILVKVNDNGGTAAPGSTAMPPTPSMTPGGSNINPAPVGNTDAYKTASQFFMDSMDTSANPCDDFYQYSCGNYKVKHPTSDSVSQVISFNVIDAQVMEELVTALTNIKPDNSVPSLGTVKKVYDQCMATKQKYTNADYASLKQSIDSLGGWPILSQATTMGNNVPLETVMATVTAQYGVTHILNPFSDTKWKTPGNGYRILLDQFSLAIPTSFYRLNATLYKMEVAKEIVNEVKMFMKGMTPSAAAPNDELLMQQAMAVADFEYQLSTFNKLSAERRDALKQDNVRSISAMQTNYPNIQWMNYFKKIYELSNLNPNDVDQNYMVTLMEPDVYDQLKNANLITVENRVVMQNYLLWRMLRNQVSFFPEMQDIAMLLRKVQEERGETRAADVLEKECANYVRNVFPWQVGRIYVDTHFNSVDERNRTRTQVRDVIQGVLNGFGSNLVLLPWMQDDTKSKAADKVAGLQINPLFPDNILDNTFLNNDLNNMQQLDYTKGFYDTNTKITKFRSGYGFRQLVLPKADRTDFLMTPAIVNAWYIPEYNSITFPAAIMNPPFFHPDFPSAMKYGGAGVVVGHELTHGFDDQGVQWGPDGTLGVWIDQTSQIGFNSMAQCVVDEYSSFCPRTTEPKCVKGSQTQGENIADNGGIRAAYRAYRSYQNINGPEPRLPGLESYTDDQLFFMSFAQVWCRSVTDARLKNQLLTDVHSPAEYRVRGAVRNFPAFAAAFNCKKGDKMFPQKTDATAPRCSVWAP